MTHQLDSHGITFERGIPVSAVDEGDYVVRHLVPQSAEIAARLTQRRTAEITASTCEVDIQAIIKAKGQSGLKFHPQEEPLPRQ